MALLLFLLSIDDVMPAVEAASKFLAYGQNLEGNRQQLLSLLGKLGENIFESFNDKPENG